MNFIECVRARRSVRRFTEEGVDRETVKRIVELAACAPSWKNSQTVRYLVVEDKAIKARIANECVMGYEGNRKIIEGAPVLVIVTYIEGRSGYERDGSFSTSRGTHWESFDAGIATQTFCLAACEAGLGTVIMGIFDETKLCETANIPEGSRVAALVALGHPAESPTMPKRKIVDDILAFL